jgi:uncharacterized membrane protein YidH (DUF202 family)
MPSPDPGAPRERTDLAWQRSAFSYLALAAVVLGIAAHRDEPALLAVSVALMGAAGVVWRQGRVAYQRSEVSAQPRVLAIMSAVTVAAAVVAAVVVLLRI